MAKYRIIERESPLHPGERVYDVEEKVMFWWEKRGRSYPEQEGAEGFVERLMAFDSAPPTSDRVVVKVYD